MALRMHRMLFLYAMLMCALIVICAPVDTEARPRVIFYGPQRVLTSQILASRRKKEPCPKCQIRDHRGNCRRIISFNTEGVKC